MLTEHAAPQLRSAAHSRILVTTPAPTVLPPSRMANRRLSCMAIGRLELDSHLDVIARHAHFGLGVVFRQQVEDRTGHVGRPEVKLGPITLEERRMPAPLFLAQDVNLGLELGVRSDRIRLADDLARAPGRFSQRRGGGRRRCRRPIPSSRVFWNASTPVIVEAFLAPKPMISTGVADLHLAALDPACTDRAAPLDREDVFDRHQERLVDFPHRLGNVLIHCLDQVEDGLGGLGVRRVSRGQAGCCRE